MKYIFVFLLAAFLYVPSVFAAPASLSFDPSAIQTSPGKTVDITVNIFTGNQAVTSTDIWIKYDPAILQPVINNTKTGSLFDTIELKEIESGKIYIYGLQKNPRSVEPVQGSIATLQFVTLKEGSTQLQFECDPTQKLSSQIIAADSNLSNVISCPATIAHTGTITVSSSDILGVSTDNRLLTQLSYILGIIVIVFSTVLFIRFQRISHELK